ncbi:MAG: hypothetical protein ACFCVA_19480 [Gammaproteobacteria bacterium]
MAAQTHTGVAQNEVLDPEQMTRSLANPLTALTQPIPNRAFFFGVNRPLGQNPQTQPMSQPTGIEAVIGILQPGVLLDARGVGSMQPIARRLQAIHQPIPVIRRFNYDPLNERLIGRELFDNDVQGVDSSLLVHQLVLFIQQRHNRVG